MFPLHYTTDEKLLKCDAQWNIKCTRLCFETLLSTNKISF